MMMNGESRLADRTRMERVARGTGQSMAELHEDLDARDYRPTKQPKLWRENTGQHYPDFLDRESTKIEVKSVAVPKPKRVVHGKTLSDEQYKTELEAQRKRAEALAYLAQTRDGVPDDCLKGEAAARRKRQQRSALSRDNTLKLVGEAQATDTYKKLEAKLLDVQARLRHAGSLARQGPAPLPPPAPTTKKEEGPVPPGWRAVEHAASRQIYYVHQDTGERRARLADKDEEDASRGVPAAQTWKPPPREVAPERRKRQRAVDPLDPGGQASGKWSDGLHHKGERMADSTATGPLWQQRPYPAPSKVLRMRGPGVREGSSIGPALPDTNKAPTSSTASHLAFIPRQTVARKSAAAKQDAGGRHLLFKQ